MGTLDVSTRESQIGSDDDTIPPIKWELYVCKKQMPYQDRNATRHETLGNSSPPKQSYSVHVTLL